jgi:hypothetical protein
MSDLRELLLAKVVTIIDEGLPYRIARRPYDEPFAEAHGITLDDIANKRCTPCLNCGVDITHLILLGKFKHKQNVYCSKECRMAHGFMRLKKIDITTNINEFVTQIIGCGLDVVMDAPVKRVHRDSRLELAPLLLETNSLLRDILKELQNGNRLP